VPRAWLPRHVRPASRPAVLLARLQAARVPDAEGGGMSRVLDVHVARLAEFDAEVEESGAAIVKLACDTNVDDELFSALLVAYYRREYDRKALLAEVTP
jgi:hypothetical protein